MSTQSQEQGYIGLLISYAAYQSVERFRYRHRCVLLGFAVAFIAVLVCRDIWAGFPRWPTYILAVLLVGDALLHAAINRGFHDEQVRAWKEVLVLATTIEAKAASGTKKPSQQNTVTKAVPTAGTGLRVFQPDCEPKRVQS